MATSSLLASAGVRPPRCAANPVVLLDSHGEGIRFIIFSCYNILRATTSQQEVGQNMPRGAIKAKAGSLAEGTAARFPAAVKLCLRIWAKLDRYLPVHPRYRLTMLASAMNYRIPVLTRLYNGMPMRVYWNDDVGAEIYYCHVFEQETVHLLLKLIKPGMVFLDIGAHIGQYTAIASRAIGDRGQVHSFEPDPDTYSMLCENVSLNGLRNVRLNRVALSDTAGDRVLHLGGTTNIGSASLAPLAGADSAGRVSRVDCDTLDGYLDRHHIECVDIIKIDVEGAEVNLLRAASGMFSRNRPAIVIEFNDKALRQFGASESELAAMLRDLSYRLFFLEDPLRPYSPGGTTRCAFNVLAVQEDLPLLGLGQA